MRHFKASRLYWLCACFALVAAVPAIADTPPTWGWSCGISSAGMVPGGTFSGQGTSGQNACTAIQAVLSQPGCTVTQVPLNPVWENNQCVLKRSVAYECNGNPVQAGTAVTIATCSSVPSCPVGKVYSSGTCINASAVTCDKNGPQQNLFIRSNEVTPPSQVMHNGCMYERATVRSCTQAGVKGFCGDWAPTGEAGAGTQYGAVAVSGSSLAPLSSSDKTPDTTDNARKGAGGGGASGSGTGYNATDAANLAKTATNTGSTVDAVDQLRSELRSESAHTRERLESAAKGIAEAQAARDAERNAKLDAIKASIDAQKSGSSSCGGPDQPACKTEGPTVNEGTIAANAATADAIAKADSDAFIQFGKQFTPANTPDASQGTKPTFGLPDIFGSEGPNCSYYHQVHLIGKTFNIGIDLCPYSAYLINFLFWAVNVLTLFGCWYIIVHNSR